jgi:glycogen debranching enzyme
MTHDIDWYATHIPNEHVARNAFRGRQPLLARLPTFAQARPLLPEPHWDGHPSAIACYWKVWELAFGNLHQPTPANAFISPYIASAHNGNLFMWDSAFILMFGRYGRAAFNFQQTLDNFYRTQQPDGFICREIRTTDGSDCFERFDPCATGPDIMAWSEWAAYQQFGDAQRLAEVFPALLAYYQWLRHYRTWPDGSYWATGWSSGMDNQPRLPQHDAAPTPAPDGPVEWWDHGHMAWVDTCFQAVLSARTLARMADVIGQPTLGVQLRGEAERLSLLIEQTHWDDRSGFYTDRWSDGSLSPVQSVGAYWGLLAGLPDARRVARLVAHLADERSFNRPHRVPTLAANQPHYQPGGGYWRGGVWAPTNYMVLCGLAQAGFDDLAHDIGRNHHAAVVTVFEETNSVWENYAPDTITPGERSYPGSVGWGGLSPVAVFLEFVLGLRADYPARRVVWDVRLTEAHGIRRYPVGDGVLTLACAARSQPEVKPIITATATIPLSLEIRWPGGRQVMTLAAQA